MCCTTPKRTPFPLIVFSATSPDCTAAVLLDASRDSAGVDGRTRGEEFGCEEEHAGGQTRASRQSGWGGRVGGVG